MKYLAPPVLDFRLELTGGVEAPLGPGFYRARVTVHALLSKVKIEQIFLETTRDVRIKTPVKCDPFFLEKGKSHTFEVEFEVLAKREEFSFLKVNLEFFPPFNEMLTLVEKDEKRYPREPLRRELLRDLKRLQLDSDGKSSYQARVIDLN